MLRYETLMLAVPEITGDEARTLETQLDKAVTSAQAHVISFEKWGKYRLAYPVRRYDYGVYFLLRFEVTEENKQAALESIRSLFTLKLSDLIMRHVVIRLDETASLDYKRPDSLEEVPTRDVDTFLKENKMTGLMGKSSSAAAHDEDMHEEASL